MSRQLGRRAVMTALAAVVAGAAGRATAASRAGFRVVDLSEGGRVARLYVPQGEPPERLLVLLHGFPRNALVAPLDRWEQSGLLHAHRRLESPPLTRLYSSVRFLGDERLAELNQALEARPFRGLAMLCPVVPVHYYARGAALFFDRYAEWLGSLLEGVRTAVPSLQGGPCGLTGTSMGGETALETFVRSPARWDALSLVQAALQPRAVRRWASRLTAAVSERKLPLQILTSTRDVYRTANTSLASALASLPAPPELRVPFGHHHTTWLAEVGCLETLLFHDRALGGA